MPTALIGIGLLLAILGYLRVFSYVSCPLDAFSCYTVYAYSDLALLLGSLTAIIGTIMMARTFSRRHL